MTPWPSEPPTAPPAVPVTVNVAALALPGWAQLRTGRPGAALAVMGAWLALVALGLGVAARDARHRLAVEAAREPPAWGDAAVWERGARDGWREPASALPVVAALCLQVGAAIGPRRPDGRP